MSATSTRHLMHEAKTQDARDSAKTLEQRHQQSLTDTRALIDTALEDLNETLADVRTLVDSRRPGVSVGGSAPTKGATAPPPINVGALSVLEETDDYLRDIRHRLVQQLDLGAGHCPWPPSYRTFGAILALVDDRTRLERIHRDLERLAEQAHRVVDGVRRLPTPCPHCRRTTLLVDHDTGITACGKYPKTGRHEPCTCTDRYCACHHDRSYRHTWSRAERAHKPTSWQGLSRAQEGALVLEAAITRVRDLHTKTPIQPWATDCDQHGHEREHLELWGEAICITCPPVGHVCRHCLDLAGSDALDDPPTAAWPCPTIAALDEIPAASSS